MTGARSIDYDLTFELSHDGAPLTGSTSAGYCKHHSAVYIGAGLVTNSNFELENVPRISDTQILVNLIQKLGGTVRNTARTLSMTFDTSENRLTIGREWADKSRNIFALLPGLARHNSVKLRVPQGCDIGARPFDWYLTTLNSFGYAAEFSNGWISVDKCRPTCAQIDFPRPSYMGSIIALIAASVSPGESTIANCSREQSVTSLIALLRANGLRVDIGHSDRVRVFGSPDFEWQKPLPIPHDREELITLVTAVLLTHGTAEIKGVAAGLDIFWKFLRSLGVDIHFTKESVRISCSPTRTKGFDIDFGSHPNFHTDWAPFFVLLALNASSPSRLTDHAFESRFRFAKTVKSMGADISFVREFNDIRIFPLGPQHLAGGCGDGFDLRGTAAVLLSGLLCDRPVIVPAAQILRGYESLETKLANLGVRFVVLRKSTRE